MDEFDVEDMDVGDIQRIVIGHDDSWPGAAWHLQQVSGRIVAPASAGWSADRDALSR